ncbi:hypothetical protein AAFF_G00284770 [Aldrovandia affinis]|uniref:Uncharacterized protein n=1 Tax=Aldrovandia affinis TaxID=143900 RepID=A0AAD7TAA2_9TELE|nr:hypothetical protein AAFF_G00284770 [Aldrovandia affinis]
MDPQDSDLLKSIHADITVLSGGDVFDASNYIQNEQSQNVVVYHKNGFATKASKKRNNPEVLSNVAVKHCAYDDLTEEDVPISQEISGSEAPLIIDQRMIILHSDAQTTESVNLFSDDWTIDFADEQQLRRAEETSRMTLASSAPLEENTPEEALVVNETSRLVAPSIGCLPPTIIIASDDDDEGVLDGDDRVPSYVKFPESLRKAVGDSAPIWQPYEVHSYRAL